MGQLVFNLEPNLLAYRGSPVTLRHLNLHQLVNAQDALSRLDERAGRHPDRAGWGAQRVLEDACDALWISGELVDPPELTLHDSGTPTSFGEPSLLAARHRIRLHTQFLRSSVGAPITTEEVFRIFNRSPRAPANDLALYDPDEDRTALVESWCVQWEAMSGETPLTRVAKGFASWVSAAVFANATPADALLLVERMSVSCRLVRDAPLALAIGARALKWRPSPHAIDEEFVERFLQAVEASARSGMLALDALDLWRERAGVFLQGRRSSSHISDVLDLVAQKGVVSSSSIERATGITVQSAARICNSLTDTGLLRELTGQRTFRIWGRG